MDRREFLIVAATCVVSKSFSVEPKKPNVLFLMSDEHSGRVMGCAGDKIVKTPVFDALAKAGVHFKSAYCQNPICVPSRASMVTGRMPTNVNVFGNEAHEKDVLRDTPVTMARTFAAAGYAVEWIGKEHWGTDNAGLGFGAENEAVQITVKNRARNFLTLRKEVGRLPQKAQPFGPETVPDEDAVVADEAVHYLDAYDGTRPFFLGVSLKKPHFPFLVEQKYYDMYKESIDLPHLTQAMLDNLPEVNRKHREKYKIAEMTYDQTRKARAIYYGMISFIDDQMGKVIRKLEEKGLRNNTIILYTSDHGDQAGLHGLWYKNSFYEDSVNVPLIWSCPTKLPQKTTIEAPVMLIDIFPTLCELCGIETPEQLEGKSLVAQMNGREKGWNRAAISESYSSWNNPGRMVRMGRWKYCWYQDGHRQFYDLKNDPEEAFNLADSKDHERRIARFHRIAMDGFKEHPSVKKPLT